MTDSDISHLLRVLTTPGIVEVNDDGVRRPVVFTEFQTDSGTMLFCLNDIEIRTLIAQLSASEEALLKVKQELETVDWDSLAAPEPMIDVPEDPDGA